MVVSLIQLVPADVCSKMVEMFLFDLENIYNANGISTELMVSNTSDQFSYFMIGKTGPNISSLKTAES